MDDKGIIDLYFDRSEKAISETAVKYGKYCFRPSQCLGWRSGYWG